MHCFRYIPSSSSPRRRTASTWPSCGWTGRRIICPTSPPICLPPRGENFLGEIGVSAGWGALSPGSRLRPQTLQAVQVPVIDNRQCERWHRSKGISVTIYDEMMCAGYKNGGRDSCQGGLGGPAHAAEDRQVVPDRDSVGGVFLRAAGTAGDLPQGGAYRGLDHQGHRVLVASS
ncbi:hypothetical protein NQ318_008639 [Aromia moschata]|uniref:Peptidase S1 domain-containing protein n=1 Tax=Aromia moschata TaxID=1265417 RepID=A0AAV8YYE3_9CUCU|nr:hypothetical protein NQ318_008639 [Aromia moschata]